MGNALTAREGASSLIVEFVGVPGVGKSTLSHRVAAALHLAGLPCTEPTYDIDHGMHGRERAALKLRLAVRGALRHPRRTFQWISAVIASRQRSFREACALTVNWCYLLEIMRRSASTPGVHVLDQGLAQGWWSLEYAARRRLRRPGFLPALHAELSSATIVVGLEATVDTTLARLKGRPGSASRVERDGERSGAHGPAVRASTIYQRILERLEVADAEPRLRVVRISNDGEDPEMIIEALSADIVACYREMAGHAAPVSAEQVAFVGEPRARVS